MLYYHGAVGCSTNVKLDCIVINCTVQKYFPHFPHLTGVSYATIACVIIYVIAFAVGLGELRFLFVRRIDCGSDQHPPPLH